MTLLFMGIVMSSFGLWAFRTVAPRLGLLDTPNSRSQHRSPIVVGAGVVVALVFVVLVVLAHKSAHVDFPHIESIVMIMAGLALVGLADDRCNLPSLPRLVLYVCASAFLVFTQVPAYSLVLLLILSVFGAWTINAFNFMDGLDGFAATQTMCVCAGIAILGFVLEEGNTLPSSVVLCALLAAALAPLMWLNWPPASVFMGDSGAIFLGFTLCTIGLVGFQENQLMGYAWLILMAPFLVDSTGTLLIRTVQGYAPHIAHSDHLYQRLARSGVRSNAWSFTWPVTWRVNSAITVNIGLLMLQALWQFPLVYWLVRCPDWGEFLVFVSMIPTAVFLAHQRIKR